MPAVQRRAWIATLAAAVSLGRRWGYAGIELRLIDGELIDPSMPASRRTQVRRPRVAFGALHRHTVTGKAADVHLKMKPLETDHPLTRLAEQG